MTQGEHLKNLFAEKGWSIAKAAKEIGIDRSALSNLANDNINLGADRAATIARGLGLTTEDVLLEQPGPNLDQDVLVRIEAALARIEAALTQPADDALAKHGGTIEQTRTELERRTRPSRKRSG